MKTTFSITFSIIISCVNLNAQVLAVTEHGDTIYVYDNGTWAYEKLANASGNIELGFLEEDLKLDTISTKFNIPDNAKTTIKGKREFFTIHYDDSKWKRIPAGSLNEDAEIAFQHTESDIYSVIIAEETIIGADDLLRIAKKTLGDRTGSVPNLLKAELRDVNGLEVVRGVLNANFSGIDFIFDSYYYSNDNGSVQFVIWMGENIWDKNKSDVHELLNGFTTTK